MHSTFARTPLTFLLLTLLLPATLGAQDWTQPWADPMDRPPRLDVSASAGLLVPTDWSDLVILGSLSSATGALEQVLVRDVRVKPGSVFGGSATYWRGRYGFRAHASYSDSTLALGDSFEPAEGALSVDVDTWMYDVRGAIGLVEYAPNRLAWPYAFVGLGGITYNLSQTISPPLLTFVERPPAGGGAQDRVIVEDAGRQFLVAIDELGLETVFAFNFGIGTDFRIPVGGGGIGLRLELTDHIAPSPLRLRIRELDRIGGLDSASAVDFGIVHHLRVAAGVVLQLGR
jgi:hypothetical protein